MARDLAGFVGALWRIDPAGGPGPQAGNAYRGVPMGDPCPSVAADARIRPLIAALDGLVDTNGLIAVWEAALAAPAWDGPPVWIHGVDEATWARGRGWGLAMTLPSPAEFADPDRAARARRVVEGSSPTSVPDVADRVGVARVGHAAEAGQALQRAQDRVVRDGFVVASGRHVRAVEQRGDVVAGAAVVLVEGHHEQAVVGTGPGGVPAEVVLQPGVADRHVAVVHVAAQVRYHDSDRGQFAEVGREVAVPQVAGRGA